MKKMVICLILATMVISPSRLWGQEEETLGDYMLGMGVKLGRGVENIVTSPAEVPCTMKDEIHDSGVARGIFTGIGKGTWSFFKRVLIGVTEIGTFIIPMGRTVSRVCTEEPVGVIG